MLTLSWCFYGDRSQEEERSRNLPDTGVYTEENAGEKPDIKRGDGQFFQ